MTKAELIAKIANLSDDDEVVFLKKAFDPWSGHPDGLKPTGVDDVVGKASYDEAEKAEKIKSTTGRIEKIKSNIAETESKIAAAPDRWVKRKADLQNQLNYLNKRLEMAEKELEALTK